VNLSKICIYNWTTIKKVKCLISVKLYGVFSSDLVVLESAPKIQFHKNKKKWQLTSRYDFHAGLQLIAKKFRYITILRNKTVICQAFQKKQIHFFCYFTNIGQSSNHIHFFENSHDSRFLTNSRSLHFTMNLLIYLKSKVRFYTEVTILICRVPFFLLI